MDGFNLPPMPRLENFPAGSGRGYNDLLYLETLNIWERVCKDSINRQAEVAMELARLNYNLRVQLECDS